MYNLKVYSYPNSKEFRLYQRSIAESVERDSSNRNHWINTIDADGVRHSVNDAGEERSQESIEHSLSSSRNRSKSAIIEYARANEWEWFITLTFNPDIVDSYCYDVCYRSVYTYFNNLRKRRAPNIKYLLVPEQHKSGRWHWHGLISCIGDMDIVPSSVPGVFNIPGYRYGYTTATPIRDTKRVSTYITKYITKDLIDLTMGRHRYIKSNNLAKADVMEYNMSVDELQLVKEQLLTCCTYFKDVKSAQGGQHITYINIDD